MDSHDLGCEIPHGRLVPTWFKMILVVGFHIEDWCPRGPT